MKTEEFKGSFSRYMESTHVREQVRKIMPAYLTAVGTVDARSEDEVFREVASLMAATDIIADDAEYANVPRHTASTGVLYVERAKSPPHNHEILIRAVTVYSTTINFEER